MAPRPTITADHHRHPCQQPLPPPTPTTTTGPATDADDDHRPCRWRPPPPAPPLAATNATSPSAAATATPTVGGRHRDPGRRPPLPRGRDQFRHPWCFCPPAEAGNLKEITPDSCGSCCPQSLLFCPPPLAPLWMLTEATATRYCTHCVLSWQLQLPRDPESRPFGATTGSKLESKVTVKRTVYGQG